jgi:microcystin-dependent protein
MGINDLSINPPRRRTRTYDTPSDYSQIVDYLRDFLVPVGSVVQKFSSKSPGEAYLLISGQSLVKADYPDLYDDIGGMFGEDELTFNLPPAEDVYLIGAGAVAAGQTIGANSFQLTVGQLPEHNHEITDPGHSHAFTADAHGHTVTDPGHSHGSIRSLAAAKSAAGANYNTIQAGNTDSATTGISVDDETVTGSNANNTTGITIANKGDGQAIDNRPKSIAVYYFIKARK